jgi:hypothetical protein
MDSKHDEPVLYTPIAGAVYRRKMRRYGHLRMKSLKNEHPSSSLFITLLVGGIHKSEISKVVVCLSNPKIQSGTSLEPLVSFCCLGLNIFIFTPKTLKYFCVEICVGFYVLLCVLIQDMREFCCLIAR